MVWRDLFQSVIVTFYRLFYHMEHHGILDQLNEVHLFALHTYSYLPRINKSLDCFRSSWNHHSIRTEHNSTPSQLFTAGDLRLHHMGLVALVLYRHLGCAPHALFCLKPEQGNALTYT